MNKYLVTGDWSLSRFHTVSRYTEILVNITVSFDVHANTFVVIYTKFRHILIS